MDGKSASPRPIGEDQFWAAVESYTRLGRPRIGFGLKEPSSQILDSLGRSTEYADLLAVGPPSIAGLSNLRCIISDTPEETLANLLAADEVDGIVRGTVDDKRTLNAYMRATGEQDTYCPALVEDAAGRKMFIAPVSNSDGWTAEQRFCEAKEIARFVSRWGVLPKIAVYTAIRDETYQANQGRTDDPYPYLLKTYEDAELIVDHLTAEGIRARNFTIELNTAIEEGCNLHVCVNGIVGNQVTRAIMACGGRILTVTRIGFTRVYEDNSRTETDFDTHIRWAAALANQRKASFAQ